MTILYIIWDTTYRWATLSIFFGQGFIVVFISFLVTPRALTSFFNK